MKLAMIFRANFQCAVLRMQLARAFDAGEEALILQISEKIDECQKLLCEKENYPESISV